MLYIITLETKFVVRDDFTCHKKTKVCTDACSTVFISADKSRLSLG